MTTKTRLSAVMTKGGFLSAATALVVGGFFISKVWAGGPGACDDGIPDARFTISPTAKAVGELDASFNASSSVACNDAIVAYSWDFGDGATATRQTASHNYPVGTFTVGLTITDAAGLTNTIQKAVVVKATNEDPVLTPTTETVLQGESVTIDMAAHGSDPDGDDISNSYYLPQDTEYGSSHNTEKGYVSRSSSTGQFVYRANMSATGQDSFQVGIRDGFGGAAIARVTINIPQRVTAVADTATTQENTDVVIPVTVNDSSYQNEPFEIYWTSLAQQGGHVVSVDKEAGTITFRPDPGFVGTTGFDYGIKNLLPNTWWTSQAHVEVQVMPAPNSAPVANSDSFTTSEDTSITKDLLANDTDPDGDALTTTLVTGAQHGIATVAADGTLTYTPQANYNGTDSIIYKVTDDDGISSTATVSITVTAVNDAPHAAFVWNKDATMVTFNAAGSTDVDNAIVSYAWNFGDGTTQTTTALSVSHKYKGKGTKTVTLVVTDVSGAQATYSAVVTL